MKRFKICIFQSLIPKSRYMYLFLICPLFASSCQSDNNEIIKIDFENIGKKEIYLSDIADDIDYISLDNSRPMSFLYQMEIFDDTIYLDEKENGMIALDMSGKIIRKYGERGRGPGGYIYGVRFTIDTDSRVIYLLDQDNLIKYSLSGTYIGRKSVENYGIHFQDLKYKEGKIYLFEYILCGEATNDWIVLDTLGTLISQKKNFVPKFKTYYCAGGGMYEYDRNLYSFNTYNDTVFSIFPDLSYKASFVFTPGKLRFPRENIDISEYSNYYELCDILETSHLILLNYRYNRIGYLAIIDKDSRKSKSSTFGNEEDEGFINDLDGGAFFMPKQYFKEKGREYMVGYTQAMSIINRAKSNDFKNAVPRNLEKKKAFELMAENLKETDNPMLTIVRLKK